MWHWERGRQGTGYDKLALWVSKRFKFDAYVLRFPENVDVPLHRDPAIEGFEHHRVNIALWRPLLGGKIHVDGPAYCGGRWMKFRPDLYWHSMTAPIMGPMYMLSIGWLRKSK